MDKNIRKITLSALLASLTFVFTRFFAIPTAIGGSINVGDAIVLLNGIILGPLYGAISAAIGSSLADLLSPFAIYTPATFIIKGLVAIVVATLFKQLKNIGLKANIIISSIIAEIVMILGYFIFEAYILEFGVIVAGYEIINNLLQAGSSIVIATIMYISLSKSNIIKTLNK